MYLGILNWIKNNKRKKKTTNKKFVSPTLQHSHFHTFHIFTKCTFVDIRKNDIPVGLCKQVILKVSASIVSIPELPGIGEILLEIAWIEWNVLAKTKYSFDVNWVSPSEFEEKKKR